MGCSYYKGLRMVVTCPPDNLAALRTVVKNFSAAVSVVVVEMQPALERLAKLARPDLSSLQQALDTLDEPLKPIHYGPPPMKRGKGKRRREWE